MKGVRIIPLLVVAGCLGDGDESANGPATEFIAPACTAAEPTSRAVVRSAAIKQVGRFESDGEFDLGVVAGLAWTGKKLYALDLTYPRVLILDGRLRLLGTFGRDGQGPGEFSVARTTRGPRHDWLAATRDSLYVYDTARLQSFGLDGRPHGTWGGIPTGRLRGPLVSRLGISSVGPIFLQESHERLFGPIKGPNGRTFDGSSLLILGAGVSKPWVLHVMDIKDFPTLANGALLSLAHQARPMGALSPTGDCLYVSDGESNHLEVFDLRNGGIGRIEVPAPAVRFTPSTPAEMQDESHPPATALWNWTRIVVDPDGWIWLLPWRDREEREQASPWRAVVINPTTEESQELTLPAFPDEFAEDGSYFSLDVNIATGLSVLTAYSPS